MIYTLVVPGPIEDVTEVRVLEWHAGAGRRLESGELIVELETHKALVEVRAARSGILRSVLCEAGEWQAIGKPLAVFSDSTDEALPESVQELEAWPIAFEVT